MNQSRADGTKSSTGRIKFFKADHSYLQYVGRIDFSNPATPRFWAPGVYITGRFKGRSCEIVINDEVPHFNAHNHIQVIIDGKSKRIKLANKTNTLKVAEGLKDAEHTLIVCKNTEANIGFIEFIGLKCEALLPPLPMPIRKIEFIGNSITCGTGSDLSEVQCDKGQWYDQHNAYRSYGPTTAGLLNAQWQLSAYSGIGLIHSCCNLTITMPQVFDKVNMRNDSIQWNFKRYQPDVVTICLGQNDGRQDSAGFCNAYVSFIEKLRSYYPQASIVCMNSPMADESLTMILKKYITAIINRVKKTSDNNVYTYFFSRRFHHGCGNHPNLEEHRVMATELAGFTKKLKRW